MSGHGPDLEKHPIFLKDTQRRLHMVLFVVGTIIACGAVITWFVV